MISKGGKDESPGYYDERYAIASFDYINPGHPTLNVIFPPLPDEPRKLWFLKKRLGINSSLLSYEFNERVLEPDIENVQLSFNQIANRIARDLYDLEEENRFETIQLIGLALGNVALAKTARLFSGFDSATMVAPPVTFADAIWEGERTQDIKTKFEEQEVTQKHLRTAWHDLAPLTHTKAFKDKDVHTIISTRDKVIPTHLQDKMPERLEWAKARVWKTAKPIGHSALLTSFCIKG